MADDPQTLATPLAEISQGPSAFELFLDRNQKSLLVLLILVILGIAGLVIYRGIEEGNRTTAGNILNRAKSAEDFQKVISAHPKTPAAATAHILLAEKQWSDNQKDAAIESLKSFLSAFPSHPGIPSAKASLAAKLMTQGKAAEAATVFEELTDDAASAYLAPYALLCLGDIAISGGDKDKAKKYYERAEANFPNSGFNEKITQRIASLEAARPVEIDPPPAPEPPIDPAKPAFPTPFAPGAQPGAAPKQTITIPASNDGKKSDPAKEPAAPAPSGE